MIKKKVSPAALEIALCENNMVINGASADIPTHISVLEKMPGKPRRVAYPKDSRKKDPLYLRTVNYAWDRLGVYCLTKNGSVVHTFGILMSDGELYSRHFPREFFCGSLTICEMPWEQAFKTLPYYGKQNSVFKRLEVGYYTVCGGYIEKNSPEKGYMLVEVQLKELRCEL